MNRNLALALTLLAVGVVGLGIAVNEESTTRIIAALVLLLLAGAQAIRWLASTRRRGSAP